MGKYLEDEFDPRYEEEVNDFFDDYNKDDEFRDFEGDTVDINEDNNVGIFVDLLDEVGDYLISR